MVKVRIYQFLLPEIITVEPQPIGSSRKQKKKKKKQTIENKKKKKKKHVP